MYGFPLPRQSDVFTEVDEVLLLSSYVSNFARNDDGIWSVGDEVKGMVDLTANYHSLVGRQKSLTIPR